MNSKKKGYVYFISPSSNSDFIKVGYSSDPIKRLHQLQTANSSKLRIIHLIECELFTPKAVEARVHHILFGDRIKGEWFRPAPEKLDWLCSFHTDKELYGISN